MEIEKLTLTIPEFATLTGCSKNLAYSLARQNKLPVPVIHLGEKRMCLSRKSVMALLEAKTNTEEHSERNREKEVR